MEKRVEDWERSMAQQWRVILYRRVEKRSCVGFWSVRNEKWYSLRRIIPQFVEAWGWYGAVPKWGNLCRQLWKESTMWVRLVLLEQRQLSQGQIYEWIEAWPWLLPRWESRYRIQRTVQERQEVWLWTANTPWSHSLSWQFREWLSARLRRSVFEQHMHL